MQFVFYALEEEGGCCGRQNLRVQRIMLPYYQTTASISLLFLPPPDSPWCRVEPELKQWENEACKAADGEDLHFLQALQVGSAQECGKACYNKGSQFVAIHLFRHKFSL